MGRASPEVGAEATGLGEEDGIGSDQREREPAKSVHAIRFLVGEKAICVTNSVVAFGNLRARVRRRSHETPNRDLREKQSSCLCRPNVYVFVNRRGQVHAVWR